MSPLPIWKREPISMSDIACCRFPQFPLPSSLLYHPALLFYSQLSLRLFIRLLPLSDPLSLILPQGTFTIRQVLQSLALHHDKLWVWNRLVGWRKSKFLSSVYTCEFTRLGDR